MEHLISVIIPIYKVEAYLRRCIDSVINQTYKNLQIILVDDGSPDNCPQICDEYATKDKRIEVIHQKNMGISAARNSGIKIAKGKYLSFIDSDDWVDTKFIETLWNLANKYNVPLCMVGRYTVFSKNTCREHILPDGKYLDIVEAEKEYFDERQALHMTFANYGYWVTNKLFNAEIFKHILFPDGLMYEDVWILFRIFSQINKIAVCDAPLYYYNRQNENSVSRGKFHMHMLDYFIVTDDFLKKAIELKDESFIHKLKHERVSHIIGFFRRMMLSGFNDLSVINPLQKELRQNVTILLWDSFPIMPMLFGLCCCINFNLTKKIYLLIERNK